MFTVPLVVEEQSRNGQEDFCMLGLCAVAGIGKYQKGGIRQVPFENDGVDRVNNDVFGTYTDMVNRAEAIVDAIHKPLIADGDTGYGGLRNVAHTVRGYEKAGVAVIQIEDQHFPKKSGHTPNRHVVSTQEMVNKIKVASDARSSADFLILVRTDALTSLGIDEALRRGEAYAEAGADILFIESPESKEQMRKIGAAFDVPVASNQLHGGVTPILPPSELQEMGFAAGIYPTAGLLAASHALAGVYQALAQGEPVSDPMCAFGDFLNMIGFRKVWDFEKKYADFLAEAQS
jgi:2,3-dimethylmalate lyase